MFSLSELSRSFSSGCRSLSLCSWPCCCRLHFDPTTGQITDQWTWRGASTDEAKWLLTRSYKPFELETFIRSSSRPGNSPHGSPSMDSSAMAGTTSVISNTPASTAARTVAAGPRGVAANTGSGRHDSLARAKRSAVVFREVFGAVPGADLSQLDIALSEDYKCQVRQLAALAGYKVHCCWHCMLHCCLSNNKVDLQMHSTLRAGSAGESTAHDIPTCHNLAAAMANGKSAASSPYACNTISWLLWLTCLPAGSHRRLARHEFVQP